MSQYDVLIIGAGFSGLAAGIRAALFDKRVCILEKHYAYGGLNSYYRLGGREFDVGLHALTNFAPRSKPDRPINKILRQLRLSREEWELCEQSTSEIRFPGRTLRFSNDTALLCDEVSRAFPAESDRFQSFVRELDDYDELLADRPPRSARRVLGECFHDPLLIEMLLCPVMYYGCADEDDMDFDSFVILFRSIFLEGLARPRGGIRTVLKSLVRRFRSGAGELRMQCGVKRLHVEGQSVDRVELENGDMLTADVVLSSVGRRETLSLCRDAGGVPREPVREGRLSFVESILVLDTPPARLGFDSAIGFFNDAGEFDYHRPLELVDLRSGVISSPNNYGDHDDLPEGIWRLTWLANHERWTNLDESSYAAAKAELRARVIERAEQFMSGAGDRIVFMDMFTPRTIQNFTGHLGGAVYGSPDKVRDGRTHLKNLFLCGTDQGLVGIIGAMSSGILMANRHALAVL